MWNLTALDTSATTNRRSYFRSGVTPIASSTARETFYPAIRTPSNFSSPPHAPSHTAPPLIRPIGGRREARRAIEVQLRCRWAAAGPGRASRSTTPSRRLACGDLAGGPPPTGTHSGQAHRAERAAAGHAKGAGTEVPAPCRLTQPLPRRGSGQMTVSPGDGDASTGTCRQRRPLPGLLRR